MGKPVAKSQGTSRATVPASVDKLNSAEKAALPSFPLEPLPFSVGDLRKAIPEDCFKRDAVRYSMYIVGDALKTIALWAAWNVVSRVLPDMGTWGTICITAPLYLLWSFYLGCVWFGIFVMGHECGHQAFSDDWRVNDAAGWLLHSFLLVPYHAWRVSHKNHHANTCSMENDEVFVPEERPHEDEDVTETPLESVVYLFGYLAFGWPLYLACGFTGPTKYHGKHRSHWLTHSALFRKRDASGIVAGDIGVIIMLAGLLALGATSLGWTNLAVYYFGPWLWCNAHLVTITYLQHTDVYVPHFRRKEWTWLRGALCTVDRTWGSHLDHTMHLITSHHVCHHIFSTMPFYNHERATEAMKPILGKYYMFDPTPIPVALWRARSQCRIVEKEGDIVFYKSG